MRVLKALAFVSPAAVFLAVYGSAVGRGFILDDFGWILQSRILTAGDVTDLFTTANGFYRPLVGASFAANYAMHGTAAAGYGWTNLVLALIAAWLIFTLARTLGLSRAAAAFAAGVWLLNFHGINMALLWISGRTSLLLVIGALASVIGFMRGSTLVACAGLIVALLSKEEAVAVPLIWTAAYMTGMAPGVDRKRLVLAGVAAVAIVAAYLAARTAFGAMTPATAPPFYRFTFDPALVGRNVLEYADRACTFAALTVLLGGIALRPGRVSIPRRILMFGAAWIVTGYAITVWLPVRSSLYACFPSVGAAVIAAAMADRMWQASGERARRHALAAVVILPLVCAPIYVSRNVRWTSLADLSTVALQDVAANAAQVPAGGWLVFVDDPQMRVNLQSAFGTLIGDAVVLHTGLDVPVWVEPELASATTAGLQPPCETCTVFRLGLQGGRLVPVR